MKPIVQETIEAATATFPPPRPGGIQVAPSLVAWLRAHAPSVDIAEAIAAGIEARTVIGLARYGQVLRASDGRPNYAETLQEVLDALQYAHRAEMDGERIDRPIMVAALDLLCRKVLRIDGA